jgi:DNA polymerase-1
MLEMPEGRMLVEFDASGQEARLLAEIGNIHSMLNVFLSGKKIHGVMGAAIGGVPYDEFMKRYKAGEPSYAGPEGLYYCGKFINLSMQYRVGAAKQRVMARVQYDLIKDQTTIERWRALYHHTYPEVKRYWQVAINKAKALGYAETLAGRRYYLSKWDQENRWSTESSAINFPIQGSGADMKNLAISTLHKKYPELTFMFSLHDGIFLSCEKSKAGLQCVLDAREALNNLDYKGAWGWEPRIPMTWDAAVGSNWANMREL